MKRYSVADMARDVSDKVAEMWLKVNPFLKPPVTLSSRGIGTRVEKLWKKVNNIVWSKVSDQAEVRRVEADLDKLFDVAVCQCTIMSCSDCSCIGCSDQVHITCQCEKAKKIPKNELSFIKAQREKHGEISSMQMSSLDHKEGKRIDERLKRRKLTECDQNSKKTFKVTAGCSSSSDTNVDWEIEKEESVAEEGEEYPPPLPPQQARNTVKIDQTAMASIRYGVSVRATAAIASAVLMDYSIITKADTTHAIDAMKVQRARDRVMNQLREEAAQDVLKRNVLCVYFDGRKDITRVVLRAEESAKAFPAEESAKAFPSLKKEEHISVTEEPSGSYLHHFTPQPVTPTTSAAEQIVDVLMDGMTDHGLEKTLVAIGGDISNVMAICPMGGVGLQYSTSKRSLEGSLCG